MKPRDYDPGASRFLEFLRCRLLLNSIDRQSSMLASGSIVKSFIR